MASPQLEAFFLFDSTGAVITAQTGMTFLCYKDSSGADVTPQPTISAIGGGAYGFTPTLPSDPTKGLVYIINTNGAYPTRISRYVRPEDYTTDTIPAMESQLTSVLSTVGSISASLSALSTTVGTMSSQLTAVSSQVTSISSTVGSISASLSALSSTVTAIDTEISSILTTVLSLSTTLSSISTTVGTISTDVSTILADTETIRQVSTGKWQIHTAGPDANRLVLYADDGITPIAKFDLKDDTGAATTTAPFSRNPVHF